MDMPKGLLSLFLKNTDPTPIPSPTGAGKEPVHNPRRGSIETRIKSLRITAHFPAHAGEGKEAVLNHLGGKCRD